MKQEDCCTFSQRCSIPKKPMIHSFMTLLAAQLINVILHGLQGLVFLRQISVLDIMDSGDILLLPNDD